MPAAFELRGPLDETALRLSFRQLVRRHVSLRFCFPSRGGEPSLRLLPDYDPLAFTDVSSASVPSQEANHLRAAHAAKPFRLGEGPLFRIHLVRLEWQRHWLLFNMHHIISDGWSIDLIIREVRVLYAAYRSGRTPVLPALPIQYTDYAIWERHRLDRETIGRMLDYWRATLAEGPEKLELPTDFPRPPVQRHASGEVSLTLNSTLVQRVTLLAQSANGTLFMALLGAFAAVLARASGQRDICIGAPVANRSQPELGNIIGLFLNTLVLRVRITPGVSFRELLATARETALSAYANQEVPFEYLVEKLQPQRNLSHHPLFQVMLNLVNTQSEHFVLDGLDVHLLDRTEGQLAKFDIYLALMPQSDGSLEGRLEFNAELFVTETIAFLAERLVMLIGQVVEHPDVALADLSVLDADWRTRTSSAPRLRPNTPVVAFGGIEQSIAARFAEQVRRNGDRIALRTTERVLTYNALDDAARRVSAAILSTPSGPHVALLLPHDAAMVVGVIGVLQAGRAYVPLDPLQPRERLAGIVADSQASVIVCTAALRNVAIEITGGSVPVFDVDDPGTTAAPDLPSVGPDHNAYLIYTSGSTGRPKGVIQSHRNVLHFTRQYTEALRISPEDRLLQVASYAFDAGVMDTFGALLNGACLHPVDFRQVGPEGCCTRLAAECITILHVTPTVFRLLARSMRHTLPSMRLVVLGGEGVTRSDAVLFRERFTPGCLLVNGFGPTESTLILQHFVDHATPLSRARLPVGYPVGDTDVVLLDPDGAIAELYGEIAVHSAHVALGYWRQPSAAFSDDPERPGKRRYRTGDLGQLLPDGSLEVVGRVDQQIKLRGFRIEPLEIEAVLRQHPSVREVAVVLWPTDACAGVAEQRLVAYVVSEVGSRDLRAYLVQKLPDYMVPSRIVPLAALPLTANGKLDRARLPAPKDDGPDATQAPATPTEELLAGVWCEVLGRESVGREDNFFDLGGHSLLATQVVARIRESVAVELPLRVLFEHPVVRDLAAAVDAAQRGSPMPPLVSCAQGPELPLSFAQQRLWFLSQLQAPSDASYNVTAALRLRGALDEAALRQALRQLTERQASLRVNIRNRGGEPLIALGEPYDPLSVEDLSGLTADAQEATIRRHADAHGSRPFDLKQDRLLRLSLLRLDAQDWVLLFAIHHIVADGWSLGVLVRELGALYAATCAGREAELPALDVQYADYAAWQRTWLHGDVLAQELAYWRAELTGAPALLSLPTDFARPAVKTYGGAQHGQRLSPELSEALKRLSRSQGATLYMTLLAAFDILLHRYSGEIDVVVGTPIANRTQRLTEQLIGFFVNTLALRTQVSPEQPFTALLAEVRRKALSAYAHQDLPFEVLVSELQPERSLSSTPLFQVMFAVQNAPVGEVRLGGLAVTLLWRDPGTAKFDLTLSVSEQEDGLAAVWEYSTDLFAAATIGRMAQHYERLLEGIVADPSTAVAALPLMGAEEAERELAELRSFNATARPYPRSATIAELFAGAAAARPEAVALVCAGATVSYGELWARANRLAHYLSGRLGPLADRVVGLLLERSADLIVAMLAVLKAGAAYLPLDPGSPPERLGLMLADAEVAAVLSGDALAAALPAGAAPVILLDAEAEAIAACPPTPPLCPATAESLAYVMYTSGSTGRPKGVCVPQRAVVRLVKNTDYARFAAEDVFLQYAPVSFDASTFEIWGALLNGAKLVLMPPQQESLEALGRTIAEQGVTTLWLTASLFNLMIEEQPRALSGLDQLLVGGEALSVAHIRRARSALPGCRLINGYGPTECTTFSLLSHH